MTTQSAGGRIVRGAPRRSALALLTAAWVAPGDAGAFQIDSNFSDPCHEEITLTALEQSGWLDDADRVPETSRADEALIDAVAFDIAERFHDPWSLALVLGARDNDLRGNSIDDLAATSQIHNDADGQAWHCLRTADDDDVEGNEGDATALEACRQFILDEIDAALAENELAAGGLHVASAGCETFLDATEPQAIALAFGGSRMVELNRFFFHVGHAVHALEDGYTHTFRDPLDPRVVRHVLNWYDAAVTADYSQARDGHAHMNELDVCDDSTEAIRVRHTQATRAVQDLLAALLDSTDGVRGRRARAEEVVFANLTLSEEVCTFDNDWCNAPELQEAAAGCRAAPGRPGGIALLVSLALCLAACLRRRALVAAAVFLASLAPGVAAANEPDGHEVEPGRILEDGGRLGVTVGGGASVHFWGAAAFGGVRWAASDTTTLGIDAEWNPWYSFVASEVTPGTANLYATSIFTLWRFQKNRTGRAPIRHFRLRTTLNAGMSVLLFDIPGAPSGSVGAYVGWALLGVSIPLARGVGLVVNPAHLSMPIPSLFGVPFFYIQYRTTIGIEWMPS